MTTTGKDLERAEELLKSGQLVAIPTETVYGLAGNAFDLNAISKIFAVKQRPQFDPLIVHVSNMDMVNEIAEVDPQLLPFVQELWPGPLTVLLPKKKKIPSLVTSGLERVAVRMPAHPIIRSLLDRLDFPLAAPSANLFGRTSPTRAEHVYDQLSGKIEYILDGGPCHVGVESTILGVESGKITVYRKGGVTLEKLHSLSTDIHVKEHSSSQPDAPGMLSRHYAPNTSMRLEGIETLLLRYSKEELGAIRFSEKSQLIPSENQIVLSKEEDFSEAARNLFDTIRMVDALNVKIVAVELLPERDLGVAINDRLRRAAAKE